jgi:hypothetical protein
LKKKDESKDSRADSESSKSEDSDSIAQKT